MAAPDIRGANLSAAAGPPRKGKQIALAFVVVYPLVTVLNTLIAPRLEVVPQPLRGILIVLCMATMLTYVLPWASRRAAGWLTRQVDRAATAAPE
jgi:antibiotic biosynthesis monooxygenase (ABM) superfamily enzyme